MSDVLPRLTTSLADRYRVERELGAGGMATVYLAHDLKHERDVALKVLHPELAAVLGAERFLTEIKTTAKLQHPHILPLLDSGEAAGLLFYVMPVVDGESLRQRLQRETQLPVDEAIRITKEVGSALDYAHRHGVIHRDIKPENILLHDNAALVTDFGIALAVTAAGGARLTQTGLSLGTPQYMAPEQAMGEKAVDARVDVYALGCVLYEMLAGMAPFNGPTAQAIMAQVLTTDALPVTTHRKTVPPFVSRAVHAALQKLPADRFASIAEFSAALDGATTAPAMRGQAAEVGTPASAGSASALRWAFVAASLAVGVAIGAVLFTSKERSGSDYEPRYYQIALPDTAPFVAGTNRYDASLRSLALTQDGRSLAYVAATPSGQRIALVRLDRGTVTVLRGTEGGYMPAFSPDGQFIAFAAGTKLQKIAIADGTVTTLAPVDYPFGLAWASTGRIYVNGLQSASGECLSSLSDAGGAPTTVIASGGLCRGESPPAGAVAGSPYLLVMSAAGALGVADTRTGKIETVVGRDGAPVHGSSPMMASANRAIFFRDSSLYAADLDLAAARMLGNPVSILTNVRREAWTGSVHVAVSVGGTLVWASGGDASVANFVWVSPAGAVLGLALKLDAVVTSYALSPDANRIAYSAVDAAGNERAFVSDLRRHVTDALPADFAIWPANWIRNGAAFTGVVTRGTARSASAVVDFSGTSTKVDTLQGFRDESRDGATRCVMTREGTRLFKARGGGEPAMVDPTRVSWCRFSPDGNRIVWNRIDGMFVSRTTGRVDASRVQIALAGADEGRWSEDGRSIYFRSANQWFVVDAPTTDMRPAGPPRLLFTGSYLQAWASWDRARDGRFLLLQGPPPVRLRTLNVMTNFPTLLEEKLKSSK